MDRSEKLETLYEIHDEILSLTMKALRIVQECDASEAKRAEAYWGAQIKIALDNHHGYLASATCSMMDTIEELEGLNREPID